MTRNSDSRSIGNFGILKAWLSGWPEERPQPGFVKNKQVVLRSRLRRGGREQRRLELGLAGEIDGPGQDPGRFLRAVEAAPVLGEDEIPAELGAAEKGLGLVQSVRRAGGSFAVCMLFRRVYLNQERELFACRNPPFGTGSAFLPLCLML